MADTPDTRVIAVPEGFPAEVYKAIQDGLKAQPQRGLVFENRRQRNAQFIQKGLTKPGKISYDTLRRSANSVHIVRICINTLKEKITKTKWVVQPIDQVKRKKGQDDKRIEEVTKLLKKPNQNNETFRSLIEKILEDLLVLDTVTIEKTRYDDKKLAELYHVDAATIRPVFDEYGNMDMPIPLDTKREGRVFLPTSYIQVMDNSQYGGPESGEIVAAWPKRDMISFHAHPQGAMEGFGYGLSPIESVLSVVANILNADNYNSTYFEEGSFPPIILHLVGKINQRDLEAFREYMLQELTGNFHRPAVTAGENKPEVIDLKGSNNRDMQFMEYQLWLAKLCCAAFGLMPQDIGLTDEVGSKNVSETQKDLSEGKGYGNILDLLREVINDQIIGDFGYEDLEFDWVAPDSTDPQVASAMYDVDLKNGSITLNEVRQKRGETPFGKWADKPMILTGEGYAPLGEESSDESAADDDDVGHGFKMAPEEKEEDDGKLKPEKIKKSVLTENNFKVWSDDRGYSQPFIYVDIVSGKGQVIKPPAAVNLMSTEHGGIEQQVTSELYDRGLNVYPIGIKTYVQIIDSLKDNPEVLVEFEKYIMMSPEYDSEKWRMKHGGSRKYPYYLVTKYIDGYALNNPLLTADMKRDPESYIDAIHDLANLWEAEKELILGDRRADQYIITKNKRAFGIDYQFKGDTDRWEKTKDAIEESLETVPELLKEFKKSIAGAKTKKSIGERIKNVFRAL